MKFRLVLIGQTVWRTKIRLTPVDVKTPMPDWAEGAIMLIQAAIAENAKEISTGLGKVKLVMEVYGAPSQSGS